jgi:hypothetical protein
MKNAAAKTARAESSEVVGSTVAMGCLPTYETAGLAAPVLLVVLRLAQGLSVGGEHQHPGEGAEQHAAARARTGEAAEQAAAAGRAALDQPTRPPASPRRSSSSCCGSPRVCRSAASTPRR